MNTSTERNNIICIKNNIQYLLSFGLFILLLGLGYIHATKGIDITDEGMYVSTAMRYSLGDVPFKDEIMNVARPFDVLISPIFRIFPNISLLQIRCLGLILRVSALVVIFLFLSRFAPPFLVSLSCAAAFNLSDISNILTPSYNTLSRDLSVLALVLWLISLATEEKNRIFIFSILGGVIFSLAIISYPPFLLLLGIPFCLLIIGVISKANKSYRHPSFILINTVLTCIVIIFIVLVTRKMLPDLIDWAREVSKTNPVRSLGPLQKALILLKEYLATIPESLLLIGILILAFILANLKSKKTLLLRMLFALLLLMTIFPLALFNNLHLLSLSFVICLVPLVLLFRDKRELSPQATMRWSSVRNIMISWGLLTVLIYGISSGNGIYASLMGIIPLFVIIMISIFRLGDQFGPTSDSKIIRKTSSFLFTSSLILPFLVLGSIYQYQHSYREPEVAKLTERFRSRILSGIYSTPEKVQAIDGVLGYLQGKVYPGDLFLAYNHIPLFYYLTHTRPAYPATWAKDDWPKSLNQRLVYQMIQNKRNAEYCLRMLVEPWDWNKRMSYDEHSPLGVFVNNKYYLEKVIYPFEILRRGPGPKLKLFKPNLEKLFFKWEGKTIVSMNDLPKTAPPLSILGARGDFLFEKMPEENEGVIRITPIKKDEKKGDLVLYLGYWGNKNSLDIKLNQGQMAYFEISLRLSQMTNSPTEVRIMDQKGDWQGNVYTVDDTSWKEYHVDRKIRDGAAEVLFGIYWQPDNVKDWMELKGARIFIIK